MATKNTNDTDIKDDDKLKNDISKLRAKMRDGEVTFEYEKKDGTKRKARGTLKKDLIPQKFADDKRRRPSEDVFHYFDLDKEDWRCFRKDNFLGIVK